MNVLTQRHRAQQLLLRKATIADMQRLWPRLDWNQLDATYPAFAVAVAALVQRNRQTSAGLAAQYLRAFRKAQGVPGEVRTVFAQPLIVDQFTVSLRATSVAPLKDAAARGVVADEAMTAALTQVSGSMARLVLNGGRETVMGTIQGDSAAVGWQRVPDSTACGFCRMLAGRGAVYKEDTVDFAAHDHCGCTVEPQYGDDVRTVKAYVPSTKDIPQADKDRAKRWIAEHL